ncbi:MAG: FKBP-type peptidyl-prolyl cis-trans isomerase [Candidatus Dormibacteria bacterium]
MIRGIRGISILVGATALLCAACGSAPIAATTPTPSPATSATAASSCHAVQNYTDSFSTKVKLTTLPDGLQYGDIVAGCGATVKKGDKVTVEYTGWLTNGTEFDSSRSPGRTPFSFTVGNGQVIPGWDEGVVGMHIGTVRRLVIPAALGYGASGSGSTIPPNATLVFNVELLSIG